MKILFVVSNLKVGGGAEKSVVLLAKGLSKQYDVELLTFYDFPEEYKCPVKRHSFKSKYSRSTLMKALRLLFLFPLMLKKFLKKNKYDLVVSNAEDANVSCLISKKYFGDYKLWTVIRNNIFEKSHPYYKFNFLQKYADKRVVLTQELKEMAPFDCEVIPNALDLEEINSMKKEAVKEKHLFKKKTILMVGRLAPQKNHKWFFDVFQELKDVNLLVIGSGPLENELKKYAKNIPNIHFLGVHKNVYAYMNKCSVLVLPSLYEGMPRVLMEALACGCVCVVNDFKSGARELLGVDLKEKLTNYKKAKYGYLVKFNNKKAFKQAIDKALRAKERVEPDSRFALERITDEWVREIGI